MQLRWISNFKHQLGRFSWSQLIMNLFFSFKNYPQTSTYSRYATGLKLGKRLNLRSLSSNVKSLISMPERRIAAIVLGNSSRATSANFSIATAALLIAYMRVKILSGYIVSNVYNPV